VAGWSDHPSEVQHDRRDGDKDSGDDGNVTMPPVRRVGPLLMSSKTLVHRDAFLSGEVV
jgi:hypothetical protein